jgi:L-lactate dehydrogenase complex protein LldE
LASASPVSADLFVTCIIDQLYPQVGVSVVRVLRRLGVNVDFPSDQTCCGQPLYNSGYTRRARSLARRVLSTFRDSDYIVVPSGSCAAMMRVFYLDLFQDEPETLKLVKQFFPRVYEFSQFLVRVLGVQDTGSAYAGKATYHPSCHLLREMEVRDEPQQLLQPVSGLELSDLPQAEVCCGFGGTFSVKYPHISEAMLADKIDNVISTGADTLVSCDMSCLMNIDGGLSRRDSHVKVRHLAQVLDGSDG